MSRIRVPIDATKIPEADRGKQKVRVALRSGESVTSHVVTVTAGHAEAFFDVEASGPVTIALGPETSDAADLFRRNTPTVTARPARGDGEPVYSVAPIVIQRPVWDRWLIWCRTFTITGYVYGQDSNPVPGAQVTASNVDWFWWWSSTSQVGTAVTDSTGYFEIDFTWCCGWLAWWWWDLRQWRLDPVLLEKIEPVLEMNPDLRISAPSPKLTLGFSALNPQPLPPLESGRADRLSAATALNPSSLPALRERLVAVLPEIPAFERLRLWPWHPWAPWFDCDPNIIFKVTQVCNGATNVILDETVAQARWDIPTDLTVTLTADAEACTIATGTQQPDGDCFGFTQACGYLETDIGPAYDPSHPTQANPLAGLADPLGEDRPFTGAVTVDGFFGSGINPDYYGVQYRPAAFPNTASFEPVPTDVLQAFTAYYYDGTLAFPNNIVPVTFAPQSLVSNVGVVTVYQSLLNYEANNVGPGWGSASVRTWLVPDFEATISLDSALINFGASGGYEFQIVGYADVGGTLESLGAPAPCAAPNAGGVDDANDLTLYFDNPIPANQDPTASIDQVLINGAVVEACQIETIVHGAPVSLEVDFTAADASGFLDGYSLTIQHGTQGPVTLISSAAAANVPGLSGGGGQPGPNYPLAVGQGAVRPSWTGGSMVLSIPDASPLFQDSCAYDLTLTVTKRNIIDCTDYDVYESSAYYSFTVQVSP